MDISFSWNRCLLIILFILSITNGQRQNDEKIIKPAGSVVKYYKLKPKKLSVDDSFYEQKHWNATTTLIPETSSFVDHTATTVLTTIEAIETLTDTPSAHVLIPIIPANIDEIANEKSSKRGRHHFSHRKFGGRKKWRKHGRRSFKRHRKSNEERHGTLDEYNVSKRRGFNVPSKIFKLKGHKENSED